MGVLCDVALPSGSLKWAATAYLVQRAFFILVRWLAAYGLITGGVSPWGMAKPLVDAVLLREPADEFGFAAGVTGVRVEADELHPPGASGHGPP